MNAPEQTANRTHSVRLRLNPVCLRVAVVLELRVGPWRGLSVSGSWETRGGNFKLIRDKLVLKKCPGIPKSMNLGIVSSFLLNYFCLFLSQFWLLLFLTRQFHLNVTFMCSSKSDSDLG